MRLTIRVLGIELMDLTVDTDSSSPESERPSLEASGGGQFEIGFGMDREDEAQAKLNRRR